MDVSLNCQLMGLSVTCRTPPTMQTRFRFPPTADRFIPFRRGLQGTSAVEYSKTEEDQQQDNNSSNGIGADNVFGSQGLSIRRQTSIREAHRRSERSSSANSLDNPQSGNVKRSYSCDENSPLKHKTRVLNFFSPENNEGRRGSVGRRGSQVFSPTSESTPGAEELPLSPTYTRPGRKIPARPESDRDLCGVREDMYSQVMSWGRKGLMAVAISHGVFILDPLTTKVPLVIYTPKVHNHVVSDYVTPPRRRNSDQGITYDVTAVEWDPRGIRLVIGNERGHVWTWKSSQKKMPMELLRQPEEGLDKDNQGQITCMGWMPTPGSSKLFIGTMNGRVELHDLKESSLFTLVKKTSSAICGIAVSPSCHYLAVASTGRKRGIVTIICTESYKVTWEWKPHSTFVKAMAWCPWQPEVLATGGLTDEDGIIKIWRVTSGKLLHESVVAAQVTDLVWSENTMELISAHGGASTNVLVWSGNLLGTPSAITIHKSRVIHLAFSPDGQRLATASGYNEEMLCIWNAFAKDATAKRRLSSHTRSPLAMCIR